MGLPIWGNPSSVVNTGLWIFIMSLWTTGGSCLISYCTLLMCCSFCWHLPISWIDKRCLNIAKRDFPTQNSNRYCGGCTLLRAAFSSLSYAPVGCWSSSLSFPSKMVVEGLEFFSIYLTPGINSCATLNRYWTVALCVFWVTSLLIFAVSWFATAGDLAMAVMLSHPSFPLCVGLHKL